MIRRLACLAPLAAAAALQATGAAFPAAVEAAYSRGLYPWIAAGLRALTGPLPFAVADLLPFAVLVLLALGAAKARSEWRGGRVRALLLSGRRLVAAAGFVYLAFLLSWGLNYQRRPLAASLGLELRPAPPEELAALAAELIGEANARRADRAEADGVFRLAGGPARLFAARSAGARPKPSRLSPLLARLGISGIFVPFTGEPLVNGLLPHSELPWSVEHERAHAAGWAREDEANFLAWRECRDGGDADARYSAALVASLYAVGALGGIAPDRARALSFQRSPAVRRDVEAIEAYVRRYEGRLARAGDRVNDAYLRSQGETRGVQSYGRMLDLLLAERRARRAA